MGFLILLGEEDFISWPNFKIFVSLWVGTSTVCIFSMHISRKKLPYFHSFRGSDKQVFCALCNTPCLHSTDVSLAVLPISKSAAKLVAWKLQAGWKCFSKNRFTGQSPCNINPRKYMNIIQKITWLLRNNLVYGLHLLLVFFFPLWAGVGNSFFLRLLCNSKNWADNFLSF